jgi:hypothetical protein
MDGLRGAARNLSSENEPWSARDQGFLLPASTSRDPPIFKPVLPGDIGLEKLSPIFRVSLLGCTTQAAGCFCCFLRQNISQVSVVRLRLPGFSVGMRLRKQQRIWLFVAVPGCFREAADRECMAAGDYQFDSEIASVMPI